MAKESYTLQNCQLSYSAYDGSSMDIKQGLAEDGVTIEMAESFGERTMGADGSSLWNEFMNSNGTITLNLIANSPAYAFFNTLHASERASGTTGRDTVTITDKGLSRTWTGTKVAIESISDGALSKTAGNVSVVLNCETITRASA